MTAPPSVFVMGRFPPPLDGQTIATARVADLLSAGRRVHRFSTSAPEGAGLVPTETRFDLGRTWHYLRLRRALSRALSAVPEAPVVWTSVSPHPLGHARDLLVTLPALGSSRPVFAVSHRAYLDRMFRSRWTRRTALRLVQRIEAVVFLTDSLAERCAAWIPPEKRVVIPNTISADVLVTEGEVADRIARDRTEVPRLLFLGNMMPEKNYDAVFDAVRHLHERGLPVRLDLVGRWIGDADRARFERRVRRAGLQHDVRAHGGISDRNRLRQFLFDADLLMFASTHPSEALPLAVLEALNTATPVVGVHHGGLPEVVRDGVEGVLVPRPDPSALATAAERVLAPDAWPDFARRARARFEARYAPEAVGAQWHALLDERS